MGVPFAMDNVRLRTHRAEPRRAVSITCRVTQVRYLGGNRRSAAGRLPSGHDHDDLACQATTAGRRAAAAVAGAGAAQAACSVPPRRHIHPPPHICLAPASAPPPPTERPPPPATPPAPLRTAP